MKGFSFIVASLLLFSSMAAEVDENGENAVGNDDDAGGEEISKDFALAQLQTEALVGLLCDCRDAENKDAGDNVPITQTKLPTDCYDILNMGHTESGRYYIYPFEETVSDEPLRVSVWCDMDTDGGGWTVFQRREDGIVDFNGSWEQMKAAFGNVGGEFWLGNDNIHLVSIQRDYTLRVELEDWDGVQKYATYDHFRVGNEDTKYKLALGKYAGDAGDSLTYSANRAFSTKDVDNDGWSGNCAVTRTGPWWYNACQHSNLNGAYNKASGKIHEGITWYHFKGYSYSLKRAEMKMRPLIANE